MTPHLNPPITIGRRTLSRVAALATVALLAVACGDSSPSSKPDPASADSPSGGDKVTLSVGVQRSGSSLVRELLESSGALEDAPYNIEWAEFDGANAAVEALNAGAVDFDIALNQAAPVLAQGNSKAPWTTESAPFKVIGASRTEKSPGIAIVAQGGSGISSVADLEGKKVSFAKGTANHYFWVLAALEAGIDPSDVELVLLPLAEARAAFQSGAVDALVTAVTYARQLVATAGGEILTTSQGRFDSYSWVVARPEVLDDPAVADAAGDLLTRLQRANEWASAHPDEVAALYESKAKQSPEDAKLSAEEEIGTYVPIDDSVIKTQQDQADTFLDQGVTASKVDVHIAFDTRFNEVVKAGEP